MESCAFLRNSSFLIYLANLLSIIHVKWKKYNESLLLNFDVIDKWHNELEKMNERKKGRKFIYPDSFTKLLGYMRIYFHLPYRQTEDIVQ